MKTIKDIIEKHKMETHNAYKGKFWCHIRKDFFSWEDFINYEQGE
tara:strand:+ start:3147 stop:3281 length:135 start_codon:yes stop_codon:yes gene_type:complete